MATALVLLAEGFEEIEAVTIVDVLRRADVTVTLAALTSTRVKGAHDVVVEADATLDDTISAAKDFDAVVLPGGGPGSSRLREDARVKELVVKQARSGRLVAAICAAPTALEAAGILAGRAATSYPGCELPSARYKLDRVVVDCNIVTSRAPATALEFSFTIVEKLVGVDRVLQLREAMLAANA